MSLPLLSREEVRALDRRAIEVLGIPGIVLMENAGRGTAELLWWLGVQGKVIVCCGKGNNGGDGFVIARHLDALGAQVHVCLFGSPDGLSSDAAIHYRILERAGFALRIYAGTVDPMALRAELSQAEWVLDALFGTGLRGPVRAPHDKVIEAINACGARVLAVDIPSGLDCDTGEPLGPTVRAEHTATFVGLKKGYTSARAKEWLGQVHVVGIGTPRMLERPERGA